MSDNAANVLSQKFRVSGNMGKVGNGSGYGTSLASLGVGVEIGVEIVCLGH